MPAEKDDWLDRTTPEDDLTDTELRHGAAELGYQGRPFQTCETNAETGELVMRRKSLPLSLAGVLVHPLRPGEWAVLHYPEETRREALARLKEWIGKEDQ